MNPIYTVRYPVSGADIDAANEYLRYSGQSARGYPGLADCFAKHRIEAVTKRDLEVGRVVYEYFNHPTNDDIKALKDLIIAPPVDPITLEIRRVMASEQSSDTVYHQRAMAGQYDKSMKAGLIRKGVELAKKMGATPG